MDTIINQFKTKYPQATIAVVTIFNESVFSVCGVVSAKDENTVWEFIQQEIWLPLIRESKPLPMFVFN